MISRVSNAAFGAVQWLSGCLASEFGVSLLGVVGWAVVDVRPTPL